MKKRQRETFALACGIAAFWATMVIVGMASGESLLRCLAMTTGVMLGIAVIAAVFWLVGDWIDRGAE